MSKARVLGAWRHFRVLFVIVHIIAILVASLPQPAAYVTRNTWSDPTVQLELQAVRHRLDRWGISVAPSELEYAIHRLIGYYSAFYRATVRPFRYYHEFCGTRQATQVFVGIHHHPARLEIDVLQQDEWIPVYRPRSSEYSWRRHQIDHISMRSLVFVYQWRDHHHYFRALADLLGRLGIADYPDATRMRVRLHRRRLPTPKEAVAGTVPPGMYTISYEIQLAARNS